MAFRYGYQGFGKLLTIMVNCKNIMFERLTSIKEGNIIYTNSLIGCFGMTFSIILH